MTAVVVEEIRPRGENASPEDDVPMDDAPASPTSRNDRETKLAEDLFYDSDDSLEEEMKKEAAAHTPPSSEEEASKGVYVHLAEGPAFKELCFDIDLTDYDDVRTCCDKANICEKCWTFITMAIKVVDVALRQDFGFKHIMWVYSGRRGAHAWISDCAARTMTDQQRKAIAGYLDVVRGGAQNGKRVNLPRPLHPHLSRSLEILKTHFAEDVLAVQDPWRSEEQAEKLLQLLPDKSLNDALRSTWEKSPGRSSVSKWADIDSVARSGASKRLNADALLKAKQDVVFEYAYPRLDIEVSKKLNHLLKSPFVVHPGTGRVCVPINTKALEDFNPLTVPTIQELLQEIDEWKEEEEGASSQENAKTVPDWEKTSLKPYIEQFRTFVAHLLKDERSQKAKREREEGGKMDF
ncbi:unnamed protein product [Parascedosporium putredinis]|uniref:DNA primase n=1 Tax=Parascedosporium putredinis TaxID=1442378 RepID=A0A9P1HBJ1_9PEZI|nr:unnamed protein product [Parascedosporium putredinis]CAI8003963.1 unnamed protein product [Parascedosporium putredinis]